MGCSMSSLAAAATLSTATPAPAQAGAYAVILDDRGRVLTVRPGNGRCYLPGGRIEPGETPRQALAREIAEECGWSAAILSPLRQCTQPILGGQVLLRAGHWRARLVEELAGSPECRPEWLDIPAALQRLHREADRAALRAAAPRTVSTR